MEVLIVLALIVLNGLFAMSEIAVVSSNQFRLQQRADAGSASARRALALAKSPNRFLSTVQIGISLIGVLAGAFGGATLAAPLADVLDGIAWLAPYSDGLALVLVVVAITYLSLVIGELVPKRLGLANPEGVAMGIAGFMHGLSRVVAPLVWFLGVSTDALLWIFRVRPKQEGVITEADIDMMIRQGRHAGVIEPAEQEIIENAFWLGERHVNDIMTPRPEVHWLDVGASREEISGLVRSEPHGRYLVCDGGLDDVTGYVATTDLVAAAVGEPPIDLPALTQQALVVPETLPILTLLERFRSTGVHIATVFDEHGGFEGLVTLSDILEELVGEVIPAGSNDEPAIVATGPGAWTVSGGLHVDDFLELLSLQGADDAAANGYQTVGGFVANRLGRVPEAGASFTWRGARIRVEQMEGFRVKRVSVVLAEARREEDGRV